MTTAEKVASMFFSTHEFATHESMSLEIACRSNGARVYDENGYGRKFVFEDLSVITQIGTFWDIGYLGCWCLGDICDHIKLEDL